MKNQLQSSMLILSLFTVGMTEAAVKSALQPMVRLAAGAMQRRCLVFSPFELV